MFTLSLKYPHHLLQDTSNPSKSSESSEPLSSLTVQSILSKNLNADAQSLVQLLQKHQQNPSDVKFAIDETSTLTQLANLSKYFKIHGLQFNRQLYETAKLAPLESQSDLFNGLATPLLQPQSGYQQVSNGALNIPKKLEEKLQILKSNVQQIEMIALSALGFMAEDQPQSDAKKAFNHFFDSFYKKIKEQDEDGDALIDWSNFKDLKKLQKIKNEMNGETKPISLNQIKTHQQMLNSQKAMMLKTQQPSDILLKLERDLNNAKNQFLAQLLLYTTLDLRSDKRKNFDADSTGSTAVRKFEDNKFSDSIAQCISMHEPELSFNLLEGLFIKEFRLDSKNEGEPLTQLCKESFKELDFSFAVQDIDVLKKINIMLRLLSLNILDREIARTKSERTALLQEIQILKEIAAAKGIKPPTT